MIAIWETNHKKGLVSSSKHSNILDESSGDQGEEEILHLIQRDSREHVLEMEEMEDAWFSPE